VQVEPPPPQSYHGPTCQPSYGYHHWSITTSHIAYENSFSILFEMLEFVVNTLQVVSKPVQPRDMSKINLPF
jgi:hypothetical protein